MSIEYWQYFHQSKQDLVISLIQDFENKNPNIHIAHNSTIPYEQFQQKLAAAAPAGQGPDVVNLYYGWLPKYTNLAICKSSRRRSFPRRPWSRTSSPWSRGAKLQGKYWGVPTAVRTLALFYNKDLLSGAGLDPNKPPTTWEEFVDTGAQDHEARQQRSARGRRFRLGSGWPGAPAVARGAQPAERSDPYTPDLKKITWTDPKGVEAFTWWTDLVTKGKVAEADFYTDDQTSFKTGHAALHVDGSFRLGTFATDAPDLNYAVAVLPAHKDKATYASFWVNCITTRATGPRLDAATKWLQYLTTPDVMRQWVEKVGELPASPDVAREPKYANDAKLGPFLQSLDYGYATFFVDEAFNRQAVLDAVNEVLLNGTSPEEAVKGAADKVQGTWTSTGPASARDAVAENSRHGLYIVARPARVFRVHPHRSWAPVRNRANRSEELTTIAAQTIFPESARHGHSDRN